MIRGVLLDLSGVLYAGDTPLPGALAAVRRLAGSGLPVRYITNTTRKTAVSILKQLASMQFQIGSDQLFTAPLAAKRYLECHGIVPFLLIHPNLEPDFENIDQRAGIDAVLVGDAGDGFTYVRMNEAFRHLRAGAGLLALGVNRYFKDGDQFSLDAGPYVRALEYAADKKATIIGKPAAEFYLSAVNSIGCKPNETVMIGDDVEADVNGAADAGLFGILVRTGKYTEGDENKLCENSMCVNDITEAVDQINVMRD